MFVLSGFVHLETFLTFVNLRVHGGCARFSRFGWLSAWVSQAKDAPVNTGESLKRLPSPTDRVILGGPQHPWGWPLMKHHCNRLLLWDKVCRDKAL